MLVSRLAVAAIGLASAVCNCGSKPPSPIAAAPVPPRSSAPVSTERALAYPATRREPVVDTLHGVAVPDPYRWLEQGAAPEVTAWMHAEDGLARTELAKLWLRDRFATRLRELARHEERTLPVHVGGRLFYDRRAADADRSVVMCRDDADGHERVILDPDQWAPDKSLSLGPWSVSPDGKRVAYLVTKSHHDVGELHVLDVDTGKPSVRDVIAGMEDDVEWTPTADGFYYVKAPTDPEVAARRDELAQACFHKLGTDDSVDPVVLPPQAGQTNGLDVMVSADGKWLMARVRRAQGETDLYFAERRDHLVWKPLVVGQERPTAIRAWRDTFYLYSVHGAPNGRVLAVDARTPTPDHFRVLVPERTDAPLMGFDLLGGKLILRYRVDDIAHVEIHDTNGRLLREIQPPGLGTTTFPNGTPSEDGAYYGFWSYDRPMEIHHMSLARGGDDLWFRPDTPFDRDGMEVEQVFFPSKDGTRLTMFIVHPRGMAKDGTAPALLFGYGGFNQGNVPWFDPKIIPWVERGGVYAFATLRGGNDYGESWHRAGMRHSKQNVFEDYVAAAEYLVSQGYTRKERLGAIGASNGGLLVAATVVQPLTDMVRFPLFGRGGIAEYGDPDDADDFRALYAYSPYHHVDDGTTYPAVLITAAASDERADAMHARKLAAALQHAGRGGPVLLRVDWDSGHMGSDSLAREIEKRAEMYAFAATAMRR